MRSTLLIRGLVLVSMSTVVQALFVQPVFAAEPPTPTSGKHIEDIVVTARQREEAAQSVPIPITAITGQQLEDRASFDMHDLERITPNLYYENSAVAKNSANIFLRGIGQINWGPAQDPKVGVYVNGVYISRAQGGLFDLLDIDRVEVLRGPQGTLFGRNTTAGLIQVITRAPDKDFAATLKGGVGSDSQRLVAGTVNVPIYESLAARFAVQMRKQDGYVHNDFDGSKWNDKDALNGRGTFLWTPRDNIDVTLGIDGQRVREFSSLASCNFLGPANGFTAGGLEFFAAALGSYNAIRDRCIASKFRHSFEDDPNHHSNIDAFGVALTVHWRIGDIGELTSITSARHMREINGSWGFISDSVAGDVLAIQQPPGTHNQFGARSQEFRLNGTAFTGKLDWVAGIYLFDEDARQLFAVPLFERTPIPANPGPLAPLVGIAAFLQRFASNDLDYDANNRSKAIYSEGTYHFTEALAVTAGVRYTVDHRNLSLTQTLLDGSVDPGYHCPDKSVPVQSKCKRIAPNQTKLTPRAILSYQATEDLLFYGSWSEGYSSGGLNQTPRLENYEPEVSKNWETGMKSQWFDQRLRVNVTGFYNTYANQQLSVGRIIDNQPVVAILNAQQAVIRGVEAELIAVPGDGWLVNFSYGHIWGKYDKFTVTDHIVGPPPDLAESDVVRDLSRNKVVLGSPYTYSLSVAKSFHIAEDMELSTQVGWSYRGRRFDSLEALKVTRQDPYGLLDARVSFNWRQLTASLWGSNLLDQKYAASKGAAVGDVIQRVYFGPPRQAGLELTYNFAPRK